MTPSRPELRDANTRRSGAGFTLVEIVVVVLILGILAGVAGPRLLSLSADSEASAILTSVRVIFDAAERYAAEHGGLPPDASGGTVPPEFEGMLRESLFQDATPFGGPYDWNGPGSPLQNVGVSISASSPAPHDRETYRALERLADDGDRSGGWITVSGTQILFSLGRNPRRMLPVAITATPVAVPAPPAGSTAPPTALPGPIFGGS